MSIIFLEQLRRPVLIITVMIMMMSSINLVKAEESAADTTDNHHQPLAPALYVFGDSLLDDGNNNLLPTLAKSNYPPYGCNFSQGPTGRFTNGRNVADYIAEFLGLPYPPPFIAVKTILWSFKWITGFNYASGACGILKDTGSNSGGCLSLDKQVKFFKNTIKYKLKRVYTNQNQLSNHLSKSLFMIAIGNNDYLDGYFSSSSQNNKRYNPDQFAQLLIDGLSWNLHRMYIMGARKVVLFEVAPLGCILRMRKPNGLCDEEKNQIIAIYNGKLEQLLENLSSSLPGFKYVLGLAYRLAYDAILNPSKYGLENSNKPCCKPWSKDTSLCIPGLPPCHNPDKYFFWDGVHLTQAAYSVIASACISGSGVCTPQNIRQLVQA